MHPRQKKQPLISAVVPVFNEEALIQDFLQALAKALKTLSRHIEIIVVDDGSRDGTFEQIKKTKLPVKALSFSRNFGKEKAITAGLQHTTGDVVLLIDADFQHPLDRIGALFEKWREGYDNVYGVRQDRKDQRWLNRLFSYSFYKLNRFLMSIDLPENAGDFRMMDRCVVDAINQLPEANRFMKGLYAWVGFKGIGVPYQVEKRQVGKSRWNFFRLFDLAITGITSFSDWPLRIWAFIGFIISLVAVIYGCWIVVDTLIFGIEVPGWATVVVGIMFLGGIQLLSIGILAEYVARIFDEVKRRPNYLVRDKVGFDDQKDH